MLVPHNSRAQAQQSSHQPEPRCYKAARCNQRDLDDAELINTQWQYSSANGANGLLSLFIVTGVAVVVGVGVPG